MIPAERIVAEMLDDVPSEDADELTPAELVKSYNAGQKIGGRPLNLVPTGVEDHQILRVVRVLRKYTLVLWDTYEQDTHSRLGFRFTGPGGVVLFEETDLGVPRHEVIDSDETIKSALSWIVLRPGDTDEEYFEKYTPAQLEFAEGDDAATISLYTCEGLSDGNDISEIIQDVPGYEHGDGAE